MMHPESFCHFMPPDYISIPEKKTIFGEFQRRGRMEFRGKLALVTGGSRGIGAETCRTFARMGADVAVNFVNDPEGRNRREAEQVAADVAALGVRTGVFEADVSDFGRVERMVKTVRDTIGPIDILVNNAGILLDKTLKKMSPDIWRSVIDVNLTGVFNVTRQVVEEMTERRWGRIVSLSSVSGVIGFFGQTNYSASKAGVIGFTKALAREVAAKGVTVNAVAPGVVETEMAALIPEGVRAEFLRQIPMGRFAESSEIAEVIVFLASDRASYITGQTIHVNGGWLG
jgi:3-oxoacyl-[acyl-carrier protein] reductase